MSDVVDRLRRLQDETWGEDMYLSELAKNAATTIEKLEAGMDELILAYERWDGGTSELDGFLNEMDTAIAKIKGR